MLPLLPFHRNKIKPETQREYSAMLQEGKSRIKKAGYVRIVLNRFGILCLKHLALAIESEFWITFLRVIMAILAFAFILCVCYFSVSLSVRDTVKASCVYGMSAKTTHFLGRENWPQVLNVQRFSQKIIWWLKTGFGNRTLSLFHLQSSVLI